MFSNSDHKLQSDVLKSSLPDGQSTAAMKPGTLLLSHGWMVFALCAGGSVKRIISWSLNACYRKSRRHRLSLICQMVTSWPIVGSNIEIFTNKSWHWSGRNIHLPWHIFIAEWVLTTQRRSLLFLSIAVEVWARRSIVR